jgi:hypothetical protein
MIGWTSEENSPQGRLCTKGAYRKECIKRAIHRFADTSFGDYLSQHSNLVTQTGDFIGQLIVGSQRFACSLGARDSGFPGIGVREPALASFVRGWTESGPIRSVRLEPPGAACTSRRQPQRMDHDRACPSRPIGGDDHSRHPSNASTASHSSRYRRRINRPSVRKPG